MKKLIITIALATLLCSCSCIAPHIDQAQSLKEQTKQLKRIADGIDSLNKGIRGL